MAKAVGVSHRSVQRIWAGAGLKPHLVAKTRGRDFPAYAHFQGFDDPNFAEKVVDVVGLYMNPPEGALVALDRGGPGFATAPYTMSRWNVA
jgi:hypothetical protein